MTATKNIGHLMHELDQPEECPEPNECDDKKLEGDKTFIQWAHLGNNEFTTVGKTSNKLDAGFYSYKFEKGCLIFYKIDIKMDELIRFPNSVLDDIVLEIEKFWNSKEQFSKYKFLHKRGYLLYGAAGSGKCLQGDEKMKIKVSDELYDALKENK